VLAQVGIEQSDGVAVGNRAGSISFAWSGKGSVRAEMRVTAKAAFLIGNPGRGSIFIRHMI
jgi:hypothetical protein